MSDKELLAQIAQVAGAINKHLNTAPQGSRRNTYTPPQMFGSQDYRQGFTPPTANRAINRQLTLNNTSNRAMTHPTSMSFNRKLTLESTPTTPLPVVAPSATFNRKLTLSNPSSPSASPALPSSPRPAVVPTTNSNPPSRHLSLVNKSLGANGSSTGSNASSSLSTPASSCSSAASSRTNSPAPSTASATTTPGQWIQSKGKNMSLMNPETFKKTMKAKQESIKSSKEAKIKQRQEHAKRMSDLRKGIVTVGGQQYTKSADGRKLEKRSSTAGDIVINGIAFEMDPRGNKLVRKASSTTAATATSDPANISGVTTKTTTPMITNARNLGVTPKQFSLDGVVYVRTTSGNLVRANLVKNQILKKRASQQEKAHRLKKRKAAAMQRPFCKYFTRFGQCSKGSMCPFVHSRTHLAICKKFLRGICPNSASTCRLSHTPSPHTVPVCSHFQRAACTKDNCVYPHIKVNPQAPICRPFATEGWCESGNTCKDRHVWICPDFGTAEGCKRKCGLAHVANGGIKKKRTAEEMEKERQQKGLGGHGRAMTETGEERGSKRMRLNLGELSHSRQHPEADSNSDEAEDERRSAKQAMFDENFIPFDLDSEDEPEENDVILSQEDLQEDGEEQEGSEEEEEEEESGDAEEDEIDEDYSSEELESVDSEGQDSLDEDDEDDEDMDDSIESTTQLETED